jgi:hypothetical protein
VTIPVALKSCWNLQVNKVSEKISPSNLPPGKNATDMFEDIGHSTEARKKMAEFLVGKLKVSVSIMLL